MPFGDAPVTALTAITIDSTTLFPCSKASARNEIPWSEVLLGVAGNANTFTAQQVFLTGAAGASPAIFRQTGGVAGTDEVQISHDGTRGIIRCKDGDIIFRNANGDTTSTVFSDGRFTAVSVVAATSFTAGANINVGANDNFWAGPTGQYTWRVTVGSGTADAGTVRAAAGVVQATNASSGQGFFADAGTSRATGDVTNATATMAAITGMTVTLAASQKYIGTLVVFASDSVGADGLQFDFNGGTATATSFVVGVDGTPIGGTTGTVYGTALATAMTLTIVSTGDVCYTINFEIVVNAAGTFIPRFAQVAHTTGTATVRRGSYMHIRNTQN